MRPSPRSQSKPENIGDDVYLVGLRHVDGILPYVTTSVSLKNSSNLLFPMFGIPFRLATPEVPPDCPTVAWPASIRDRAYDLWLSMKVRGREVLDWEITHMAPVSEEELNVRVEG